MAGLSLDTTDPPPAVQQQQQQQRQLGLGVGVKQQPQQPQNQPLLLQGSNQLLTPWLQLPADRALLSTQQTQPQSAQDQQQQLQSAVQQMQALCQMISTTRLSSGFGEIDAARMLGQLGAIEEFARMKKKAIRKSNAQHPSSPPAQRRCREVCSRSLASATTRSVMLTSRHEHSRMAAAASAISDFKPHRCILLST